MRTAATTCTNLNHRRTDAPVRFCPSCGAVVNPAVRSASCQTARHDAQREMRLIESRKAKRAGDVGAIIDKLRKR